MKRILQNYICSVLTAFIGLGLMGPCKLHGQNKTRANDSGHAPAGYYLPDLYQILNINNLSTWMRRDGQSNHSPTGDNGTYFPRGTAWVVYQDGFVFGSKAYADSAKTKPGPYSQLIRVGGATYSTGMRTGWVTGLGAEASPIDPGHPRARTYRIRRDWRTALKDRNGNFTEELRRDTAESNEIALAAVQPQQMQAVYDRYRIDWNNWPVDLGAPFIDRNRNGVYDEPPRLSDSFTHEDLIARGYDEPGIALSDMNRPADQVVWAVCNDLHQATSVGRFGSEPTGLEIQTTQWAYKSNPELGNVFFRRIRFINKGGVEIDYNNRSGAIKGVFWLDSMYVGQFADVEIGSRSDDLVGCDTLSSSAYAYNGNASDADYQRFNLAPPAVSYCLLQGPIVPASGKTAFFDLKTRSNFQNLSMTAHSYSSDGSVYRLPGGGYSTNTLLWHKMLRGFAPLEGKQERYAHLPGVTPGPFPLAGDPISGEGHIDGLNTPYSLPPRDRSILLASGPFQMAPRDTQEVVLACAAGLGADRLSGVAYVKALARRLKAAYPNLENLPVNVQEPRTSSAPESFVLRPNQPNPFAHATRIAFTLARASEIKLAVYDLLGREILLLAHGRKEPGQHSVLWPGVDQRGRLVPSGVYFYRLQVDNEVALRKLALFR
jgi:hypothetical protein